MGDVGSLSLGGALGTVAILIKQELLLFLVGGLFMIEAFSVIVQVASFRLTGRRGAGGRWGRSVRDGMRTPWLWRGLPSWWSGSRGRESRPRSSSRAGGRR